MKSPFKNLYMSFTKYKCKLNCLKNYTINLCPTNHAFNSFLPFTINSLIKSNNKHSWCNKQA